MYIMHIYIYILLYIYICIYIYIYTYRERDRERERGGTFLVNKMCQLVILPQYNLPVAALFATSLTFTSIHKRHESHNHLWKKAAGSNVFKAAEKQKQLFHSILQIKPLTLNPQASSSPTNPDPDSHPLSLNPRPESLTYTIIPLTPIPHADP